MKDEKIIIRLAELADVEEIELLEKAVWQEFPASAEKISSRIKIFPKGSILAIEKETGRIIGYLSIMLVDQEAEEFSHSWDGITANGKITNHNPNGKYMYGVNLTVAKGCSAGLELQIYAWATIAIGMNRRGCFLGSPMPGFAVYKAKHPEVSAEDYALRLKRKGKPFDPELAYYESAGFKALRVLEDYEPDSKSLNYGVLVYCRNIFYNWPCRWLIAWLVKKFGFKLLKKLGV